ncbi:MAG: hypothetical protein V9F03_07435 [Microthrixaceae bacterium]
MPSGTLRPEEEWARRMIAAAVAADLAHISRTIASSALRNIKP